MSNALPANTTDAAEFYANGLNRPACMRNLPDWALGEFLARHAGPALDAARDEAAHRGWNV